MGLLSILNFPKLAASILILNHLTEPRSIGLHSKHNLEYFNKRSIAYGIHLVPDEIYHQIYTVILDVFDDKKKSSTISKISLTEIY